MIRKGLATTKYQRKVNFIRSEKLCLVMAYNGLVLAAWRHRSRKAIQQNKSSWKNTLSQTQK
jgi:hypothetical protein